MIPGAIGPTARAAMLAEAKAKAQTEGQGEESADRKGKESRQWPAHTIAERPRYLPPLYELIESGKVLALNMPAGSNPALAPRHRRGCSKTHGSKPCSCDRRR